MSRSELLAMFGRKNSTARNGGHDSASRFYQVMCECFANSKLNIHRIFCRFRGRVCGVDGTLCDSVCVMADGADASERFRRKVLKEYLGLANLKTDF